MSFKEIAKGELHFFWGWLLLTLLVSAGYAIFHLTYYLMIPVVTAGTGVLVYRWYRTLPKRIPELPTMQHFPTADEFLEAFGIRAAKEFEFPNERLTTGIFGTVYHLYEMLDLKPPAAKIVVEGSIRGGQFHDEVLEYQTKILNLDTIMVNIADTLLLMTAMLLNELPSNASLEGVGPSVPLRSLLPENIDELMAIPFFEPDEFEIFKPIRDIIESNTVHDQNIFTGTPVKELLNLDVPFLVPENTRFEGQWVIAPPGRGKTVCLTHQIRTDIEKPCSVILMDSKGDLLQPFKDRKFSRDVMVVEPDPTLALNPLSIGNVELMEYFFSTLIEANYTPLQSTLFRSILTACNQIPNATLHTFRDINQNGIANYKQHITDPDTLDFFKDEFPTKTYTETRQQIQWRLRRLMSNSVMKGMFSAPTTKLKLAELMDRDTIVVVNNSKALLGDEGSEFFGRFFIALILQAAQQRRSNTAHPCYVYIDECHTVIRRDDKLATILDECRSKKIALTLAHQRIEQITNQNVLGALSNCAIRYANSDEEASQLAPRLRTTADHLRSLPKGSFAAFVRDTTKQAITLRIPLKEWDNPKLTPAELAMRAVDFKARYCYEPAPEPVEHPSPQSTSAPKQSKTEATEEM